MIIDKTPSLRNPLLTLLFVLSIFADKAFAEAPTVVGNTISWPDDGRYQVQLTLTGEIVCEGIESCMVSDGNYRVTRFSDGSSTSWDVVVGVPVELVIDQSNFLFALNVSGRVINWSVDGWYQVQDAHTFEEICNGADSCTVPSVGRYTVINHDLGLRTEIEVSENS